ncbi:hypothetical protein Z517_09484 [Fonsecaea pedrosoi CBS 271.37]|uniref:Unplaced genomic scaffold supercont1.6, whole genome shotgun sequence n=1 Tax=Fonsecaea pedrosoi CBS 271.37 TaxID=1442368 RepID=A0A0D2G8Q1_9EURO|nr:uncharacterized protein Z517_09484 [Fonsecaea pedrosoi CBS 271.37]KIW77038.1 hypothetical protein Z517_09484 [Fonsecaea pedrosoi CBS 271.37]
MSDLPHTRPAKPWAGGRILTPAQRERKRAANRASHRNRRYQAAARTASLESQIELLKAEIEVLKRREGPEAQDCLTSPRSPLHPSSGQPASQLHDPLTVFASSPIELPDLDLRPSVNLTNADSGGIRWRNTHGGYNHNYHGTEQTTPPPTSATSCQEIFNLVISQARRLSAFQVSTDDTLNQDMLVRALVNGWADVLMQYGGTGAPCPLWSLLHYLDRRIFCKSGFMTRLCTLRMTHAMLLCFVGASSFRDLPAWYRPRPSQHTIRHALAVDVLPWPGVRERAVHAQGLTRQNQFWTDLVHRFRFHWPYHPTEAVQLDADTGLFALSGLFLNQVHNINMWKVDLRFFDFFPDLYDDIMPSLDGIERPLSSCILPPCTVGPTLHVSTSTPGVQMVGGFAALDGDHIPALPLPETSSDDVSSEPKERQHASLAMLTPLTQQQQQLLSLQHGDLGRRGETSVRWGVLHPS